METPLGSLGKDTLSEGESDINSALVPSEDRGGTLRHGGGAGREEGRAEYLAEEKGEEGGPGPPQE